MAKEEVELDFEFSNEELANFLDNFADKIRDGDVGLSFSGRQSVDIEPSTDNHVELEFFETNDMRQLEVEIKLREEIETTEEGRRKLKVEIV